MYAVAPGYASAAEILDNIAAVRQRVGTERVTTH